MSIPTPSACRSWPVIPSPTRQIPRMRTVPSPRRSTCDGRAGPTGEVTMKRWEERIDDARQRRIFGMLVYPRFSGDDRELASNWATCAVGEVRRRYGVRMDRTLGTLGVKFYRAVLWNMVERAAEIRDAIDIHALQKKREEWEQQHGLAVPESEALPGSTELRAA